MYTTTNILFRVIRRSFKVFTRVVVFILSVLPCSAAVVLLFDGIPTNIKSIVHAWNSNIEVDADIIMNAMCVVGDVGRLAGCVCFGLVFTVITMLMWKYSLGMKIVRRQWSIRQCLLSMPRKSV